MGKLIDKQRVIFRTKKKIPTATWFFHLFFLHKTTCPMLFFHTFADIKRNKSENPQTKRKQKVIQNGKLFKIQDTRYKRKIPT